MSTNKELLEKAQALNNEKKYSEVIELLPDNLLEKLNDADLYVEKAHAHHGLYENDFCENAVDKALVINPNQAKANHYKGNIYVDLKKYDEAIRYYNKAIESNPKYANPYNGLGDVYSDLKEYDKTIENYNRAIELDPKNAYTYTELGNVYKSLQQYDKAIENYNRAIELNSKGKYSYQGLGVVYINLKDYEKAIKYFNKAIELDHKDAYAYNGLGNAYYCKKEFNKANESYKEAIEIDPNFAYPYNGLGNVYNNLKEYDKAIENYNRAIELNPGHKHPFNGLGIVYNKLKKYDKAIENFNKAIKLDSKYALPYYNRAITYRFRNEYQNALNDFEKYIEYTEDKSDYFALQAQSKIEELNKSITSADYGIIEQLVKGIKDILLIKNGSVTHYTSLTAAKAMILDDSKFRLSECAFLNDSSEGRELFKFLGISEAPTRRSEENCAMPFTRKPFIGSFVSDIKHDDLTLWRMYGKESKEEAKGCSITLDSKKLQESLMDTIKSGSKKDTPDMVGDDFNFYRMVYRTQNKENLFVVPGAKDEEKELNICMNQLAEKVKDYIANVKKKSYSIKDLLELLNSIAYLFKSVEYQYEHEIRMVVNGAGLEKKINSDNNQLRVYIETVPINPIIQKITLGPKVERAEEWAAAFYYELDKQRLHPEIYISHLPFK
ncbi:MAG: tetratricopeptide repeat protein [Bacteroidales bacterium]|nr:tetratricopeptide repeat protein [Bacteroidales bacterium]